VNAAAVRLLQVLALWAPGARSLRVWLHRRRGVTIGSGCFIGASAILDTHRPGLISIGSNVNVGIRSTIVAHFRGSTAAERGDPGERFSVVIEDDVFIGPHAVVLPGVRVGRGAVVTAGSVVSTSVEPMTLVQGNPARPVARCGIPLGVTTKPREFRRHLLPYRARAGAANGGAESPRPRA
jgi:acetyltransferase-like isoleucine patch superfamily enzyme